MKNLLSVFAVGALALTACNDTGFVAAPASTLGQNNNGGGNGVPLVDQFNVPVGGAASKVDVLFMIDNSGSMAEEQTIIGNSFADFIAQFTQGNADFHLGVITTDVDSSASKFTSALAGFVNPSGPGNLLTRYAGERYLTNATSNLNTKFPQNAKVGITGSGAEQGLNSVAHFLSASKLAAGGANAGFIREDALLSVIFVTDEDEGEKIASGETIDGRIGRLLNRIHEVKGPNSPGFRFDFIINSGATAPVPALTGSSPIPISSGGLNAYPNVYLRAAALTGSKVVPITQNFAPDLVDIGGSIVSQGQSEFKLSAKPIASSIQVTLGGIAVPMDSANGYILHADRNTIELRGSSLSGAPGKVLRVSYNVSII